MNTAVGREGEAPSAVIPSIRGTSFRGLIVFRILHSWFIWWQFVSFKCYILTYPLAVMPTKNLDLLCDRCIFFIIWLLPPICSLPAVINHLLCLPAITVWAFPFSFTFWLTFKKFHSHVCLVHFNHMPSPFQRSFNIWYQIMIAGLCLEFSQDLLNVTQGCYPLSSDICNHRMLTEAARFAGSCIHY
jgi:hypothetical protein